MRLTLERRIYANSACDTSSAAKVSGNPRPPAVITCPHRLKPNPNSPRPDTILGGKNHLISVPTRNHARRVPSSMSPQSTKYNWSCGPIQYSGCISTDYGLVAFIPTFQSSSAECEGVANLIITTLPVGGARYSYLLSRTLLCVCGRISAIRLSKSSTYSLR